MAKALHVSTFYFCKMFKKATGLTFVDYLGRVRIEKAKTQLLNPNRRVSEIAYDIGLTSLTNFDRVFKKAIPNTPTITSAGAAAATKRLQEKSEERQLSPRVQHAVGHLRKCTAEVGRVFTGAPRTLANQDA